MEISISRALTELKTINSRIENKINNASFIAGVKNSSTKINNIQTRDEFIETAKSTYESITSLIERRKLIKAAIIKSNAETKVLISGKEYTVADAIERKTSIELDKMLLGSMERQYSSVVAQVNRNNDIVEQNLNNLLEKSLSSDKKEMSSMSGFAEQYKKDNGFEIINPLKLQERIETLRDEITGFENEVDAILSESNAIIKIEIPD